MTTSPWPVRPLIECGRLLSGGTPSKANAAYWEGHIPWYSSKELKAFELSDSELHVSSDGATNGSNLVPPGTVLFVVRGMSLANEFRVSRTLVEATFNQDVKALIPAPDLDSRYLTRCLRWLQPRVLSSTEESSHGTKRLSGQVFENLPVPVPPLAEQRRIADILDKADAIRRKRRETIALTEELLRSSFLEMFGDPVTNPKGWPVAELRTLLVDGPQNGLYRPSSDYGSGTRILRIDSFYDGEVEGLEDLKRVRVVPELVERYGLKQGDIVINRVNSRKYLGKSAIIPELPEPTIFESNMMRMTFDSARVDPRYLVSELQQPHVRRQIDSAAKDAVNQSSINQGDVQSFRVRLPPLEAQEVYAHVAKQVSASVRVHVEATVEADTLFNSLVARTFSGALKSSR